MIKRCNDFGAGGVSVAIGELADGLYIDLNKVPRNTTASTAPSWPSARPRSAWPWPLPPEDVDKFIAIATEENLEATPGGESHRGEAPEHGGGTACPS